MSHLAKVYIGLGSNLGNRLENLQLAINAIRNRHQVLSISSVYMNPPLGFEADTDFYNAVICIETTFSPKELLNFLKNIEKRMGRSKKSIAGNYESRIIDLDILDFNQEIYDFGDLTIPHAEIGSRNFVIFPLQEIAATWVHPVFNKNLIQLAEQLTVDGLLVKLDEKLA